MYDAATDREIVDPNSYHSVNRTPVTIFKLLMSVTLGMQNAAYIIFFLLIIGGMFTILNVTGVINAFTTGVAQGIAFTVWGNVIQSYYIDELATIFLAIGIIGDLVGGLKPSKICDVRRSAFKK